MRIGFHGGGFKDAIANVASLLPDDDVGVAADLGTVDILIPAKRHVDGAAMDERKPTLVHNFGAG